jgi:integrase
LCQEGVERDGPVQVTPQAPRHLAATWLDAAGVRPKIVSVLMGHATPGRQRGADHAREVHGRAPEDVEDAREKLAAYIAEHQEAKASER